MLQDAPAPPHRAPKHDNYIMLGAASLSLVQGRVNGIIAPAPPDSIAAHVSGGANGGRLVYNYSYWKYIYIYIYILYICYTYIVWMKW